MIMYFKGQWTYVFLLMKFSAKYSRYKQMYTHFSAVFHSLQSLSKKV